MTHAPENCFSGACDSSKELPCNPIEAAPTSAQLSLFKTEVNMKGEHVRRDNIKALLTARLTIELNHGQHFCETLKAYEIWEIEERPRIPGQAHQQKVGAVGG